MRSDIASPNRSHGAFTWEQSSQVRAAAGIVHNLDYCGSQVNRRGRRRFRRCANWARGLRVAFCLAIAVAGRDGCRTIAVACFGVAVARRAIAMDCRGIAYRSMAVAMLHLGGRFNEVERDQ